MMTKEQVIKAIYGENPSFAFDYALPMQYVDMLVAKAIAKKTHSDDRETIYRTIVGGCVYAYSKDSSISGLLPITHEAYTLLILLGECVFVPTINIKNQTR